MQLMLFLVLGVSCLRVARQQGASSDYTWETRSVSTTAAGGACFGPSCCVRVERTARGTCQVAIDQCRQDDLPLLAHLELAFVCKASSGAFTHHSAGYVAADQAFLEGPGECEQCFAPRKSDFRFVDDNDGTGRPGGPVDRAALLHTEKLQTGLSAELDRTDDDGTGRPGGPVSRQALLRTEKLQKGLSAELDSQPATESAAPASAAAPAENALLHTENATANATENATGPAPTVVPGLPPAVTPRIEPDHVEEASEAAEEYMQPRSKEQRAAAASQFDQMVVHVVSGIAPGCLVDQEGATSFSKQASPCCKYTLDVVHALAACENPVGGVPEGMGQIQQICLPSCYAGLKLSFLQPKVQDASGFCEAFHGIGRAVDSLLDSICSSANADGAEAESCADVLGDAMQGLKGGGASATEPQANATEAPPASNATANATALLARASPVELALLPGWHAMEELWKMLRPPLQLSLVQAAEGPAQGPAQPTDMAQGMAQALGALCSPCFERALGGAVRVLNAVFDGLVAGALDQPKFFQLLNIPAPQKQEPKKDGAKQAALREPVVGDAEPEVAPLPAEDLRAMEFVVTSSLAGVCLPSPFDAGSFCVAEFVAKLGEHGAEGLPFPAGAEMCTAPCGKVLAELQTTQWLPGSQVARPKQKWMGAQASFHQVASVQVFVETDGCTKKGAEYCIDNFWAYIDGLKDFGATVEEWMDQCAEANQGTCGGCAAVLDALEDFGCCRAPMLRGMLLLGGRHSDLVRWGVADEGASADPWADAKAIDNAIGKWTRVCERPEWNDPCETCAEQVAFSMRLPEGVTKPELREHQFALEAGLVADLAANAREPRATFRVLAFGPEVDPAQQVLTSDAKDQLEAEHRADDTGLLHFVVEYQAEECQQTTYGIDLMERKVREQQVVFFKTPAVIAGFADPEPQFVHFTLLFAQDGSVAAKTGEAEAPKAPEAGNQTGNASEAQPSMILLQEARQLQEPKAADDALLAQKVAVELAARIGCSPDDIELTPTRTDQGLELAGRVEVKEGRALANFEESLVSVATSATKALGAQQIGLEFTKVEDVRVSVGSVDPVLGLVPHADPAHAGFGPDKCLSVSQAASSECILTTRNCDVKQLAEFEVAFLCEGGLDAEGRTSEKKVIHSYGLGGSIGGHGFLSYEEFHSGIKCGQCLPPPTLQAAAAALVLFLGLF